MSLCGFLKLEHASLLGPGDGCSVPLYRKGQEQQHRWKFCVT